MPLKNMLIRIAVLKETLETIVVHWLKTDHVLHFHLRSFVAGLVTQHPKSCHQTSIEFMVSPSEVPHAKGSNMTWKLLEFIQNPGFQLRPIWHPIPSRYHFRIHTQISNKDFALFIEPKSRHNSQKPGICAPTDNSKCYLRVRIPPALNFSHLLKLEQGCPSEHEHTQRYASQA